ncbi:MAG TPA: hypothetical protein V6C97_18700 [Oculatellaceae cyanobacterium]
MAKGDRREKLALDEAYRMFHKALKDDPAVDIFSVARSLRTVTSAVEGAGSGQFKLTVKLWQRIQRSLFDKLITNYPAHMLVFDQSGQVLKQHERWNDEATLEIHPEGLRRNEDCFRILVKDLQYGTRARLERIWTERGPSTRKGDFVGVEEECGEYCTPKNFVIGDDVLRMESTKGKEEAYAQWWDLFWQSYCTSNDKDRHALVQQMNSLESVWGNLYY